MVALQSLFVVFCCCCCCCCCCCWSLLLIIVLFSIPPLQLIWWDQLAMIILYNNKSIMEMVVVHGALFSPQECKTIYYCRHRFLQVRTLSDLTLVAGGTQIDPFFLALSPSLLSLSQIHTAWTPTRQTTHKYNYGFMGQSQ
jgi:hypothetical protein